MKIAVTGGAGFIGSKLVERLMQEKHDVISVDVRENPVHSQNVVLDVTNEKAVTEFLGKGTEIVFHLAGPVVETVRKQPKMSADVQLRGTLNILDGCRLAGVKKVVLASSFYVYAGCKSEEIVNEVSPLDVLRTELFGASKLMSERLVRSYSEAYGLEFVMLRFGSAYGFSQHALSSNVIRTFLEIGTKGETLEVWGKGERRNQYTYVDDIVDGCVRAMSQKNQVYNLISPEITTTGALARALRKLCGFEVVFNEDRKEGSSMAYMSSMKAMTELGWQARSLEDGIRITATDFAAREVQKAMKVVGLNAASK